MHDSKLERRAAAFPNRRRPVTVLGWLGLAWLALVLGLAPLPLADAAPGEYHEDTKYGYKVKSPKGWGYVPMGADEKWIAGKFLSDKAYTWTDPDTNMGATFKPVMQVIVFIDEVVKKRGVEMEEGDDGDIWISLNNPYKDYKDFLDKTYRGGGWFVSAEEEAEHRDLRVTQYEIKVEKLSYTGPKRIVTWVFHTEEVDFAVQFEVLEDSYRKLKSDIYSCLKSFRTIPRDRSLTAATTGGRTKLKPEGELTLDERTKQRKETEGIAHRKASEGLPGDWKVKEMGRFLVLNHADEKYAKKVVAHAEAVWKWLDKNFDYVGKGEYVRRPILRICANRDEESAFRSGTSWGSSLEIVTHQDKSAGAMSWELEYVNTRLVEIWFQHRNRDLYSAMPNWLSSGFRQVLGTARASGRKLEFKVDDWEREGLRKAVREEKLIPPRDLVQMSRSQFWNNQSANMQAAAFIRFILEARSKKTRVVLQDYLTELQTIVAELNEKEKKDRASGDVDVPTAPQTEEEEDEAFKNRQKRFEEKETEFLTMVFDRAFGEWSDKDWDRLKKVYFKSVE